jgi:serine/threonine protein kinase/tetratricopeptide (TPR) repeat protein
MIGKTLGQHKIIASLGKGGMAEVYRAEDTNLRREVALKILPEELAANPERLERFKLEARAVAALNHPGIVTIYSVEQDEGVHYMTMELIDGLTLDLVTPPVGLPLKTLFQYSLALADALSAAHHKGIIHRDLKPANIMITREGRLKILDFGIAKLQEPTSSGNDDETLVDSQSMTREGGVLGTTSFMSPEQAEGKPVDSRSDIFSLGVLLYEMATGKRPFTGKTEVAVVAAIIKEEPVPVAELRADLPHHLTRIIKHCLAKDPQNRYQSSLDVRNELKELEREIDTGVIETRTVTSRTEIRREEGGVPRWWYLSIVIGLATLGGSLWFARNSDDPASGSEVHSSGAPLKASTPSIAVLPFVDMSPQEDQEYFSDGLTEELLTTLAKNTNLRVAARTSSFAFKGQTPEIAVVGAKLQVKTVLEGSVRRIGNRARITTQLINVEDGFQIWSESFDRELDDIFAVQAEIANAVAMALKVRLSEGSGGSDTAQTVHPEAYTAYLQGRHFSEKTGRDFLDTAVTYFEKSLAHAPDYAPAWVGLAEVRSEQAGLGYVPVDEGYADSRQAAERALELDPTLASAHVSLGEIKLRYDWDWAGADLDFQKALALEPGNAGVILGASRLARTRGRLIEALVLARRSSELDPLNVRGHHTHGLHAWYANQLDEAAAALEKAIELDPNKPRTRSFLGRIYLAQSRVDEALSVIESEPHAAFRVIGKVMLATALENSETADTALAELLEEWGDLAAFQIAEVYGFRGEVDNAFIWLEKAYAQRDSGLTWIQGDPHLRSLATDPRWDTFLKKMRLTD